MSEVHVGRNAPIDAAAVVGNSFVRGATEEWDQCGGIEGGRKCVCVYTAARVVGKANIIGSTCGVIYDL